MTESDHLVAFENKKEASPDNKIEFLANISHEIRNPLNAIIGISRLLKDTASEEDREKYIDILLQTSGDLLELINNIMDFSKLDSGNHQFSHKAVDLQELLRKSVLGQKALAESKGLDLVFEINQNLPPLVVIDPVKINQVVTNLVSNAIKFTQEGSVKVLLDIEDLKDSEVTVKCTIRDTGIGIPEEKLDSIFDAFDQGDRDTSSNYGGTGLGLTISRRIIDALGGELKVRSSLNRGSEFSFVLPLKIEHHSEVHAAEIKEIYPEVLPEGIKILVVDDNKVNVLVVQKHLELWGFDYEIAYNGLNAVKKVQQQKFDLVLMDLHMPGMDGLEATEVIRNLTGKQGSPLPVIGLTASTERFYQGEINSAGFTDFIIKPFHPQELLDKIALHCKVPLQS